MTNTSDSGAGSLRQALAEAQDGDTITFSPSRPTAPNAATSSTITLTTGQLTIDKNITISGPGADVLTVARDATAPYFRIFLVTPGHTVTIEGITISNGVVLSSGGGIYNDHSTLTVKSCALTGNIAAASFAYGGGIFNDGTNAGSATLTVVNSTLSGNSAGNGPGYGGGISNNGNSVPGSAMLTVVNSTLSDNHATTGVGGIYSDSNATVVNSTLSGNGAQFCDSIANNGVLTIGNTILKTGTQAPNIAGSGTITSLGYNLSNDAGAGFLTATGDQINTDPMLGPLQNNGGPTLAHAPFPNSPAIDRGKDIGATGRDQPGNIRPFTFDASITPPGDGDRSDIGAVELPQGIYGTIFYCSNPVPSSVPNVTLNLTGATTGSTISDGSGNYQLLSLVAGGSYTVTPTKGAMPPGSSSINTSDVIATQQHYLNYVLIPVGCRRDAADVNGDTVINTVDAMAIQRFFIGRTFGLANVGKYQFNPANRAYSGLVSNQTGQNYDTMVLGDVTDPFAERPDGPSQSATEIPATVAAVALPEVVVDSSKSNFIAAVTTSAIDSNDRLIGFQGDFTFDERVVTFADEPVQKAGLTGGNWNVSGNVLDGPGPIRTLRISAFSLDLAALSGSGTLFELRMTRVKTPTQGTPLIWAAAPDHFIFIDADLNRQRPANAAAGSVNLPKR